MQLHQTGLQTWALDRLMLFWGRDITNWLPLWCNTSVPGNAPACSCNDPLAAVVLTADLEYMRQHACVTDMTNAVLGPDLHTCGVQHA
jgi:hypothetical protein